MHIVFEQCRKWLVLIGLGLALSGCEVEIASVNQPTAGQVNVPFDVQVAIAPRTCQGNLDGGPQVCRGALAVSLPTGWTVDSCAYTGSVSGTCTYDPAITPTTAPTTAGQAWQAFRSEDIHVPNDADLHSATVTLRIRPTTLGTFYLDYQAYGSGPPPNWGAPRMNVPITIGTTAVAVPTLDEWALMALGLLAAGLGLRRIRRQSI